MATPRLPEKEIAAFCRKWDLREFSLFGSALTEHFHEESDIDVMVSFRKRSGHSLFDLVRMQQELREIFGRNVDLLTREGIENSSNPIRKKAILDSAKVLYAEG
ncbi:MAG: nucleotidyltransferase domain-containing protein [Desulfobacteraceae bacterium]|jgi:predicted nucleotidyltransferase